MKKPHPNQILFLGVAFVLAVSGLTMALHKEAIAGPLCPACVCSPAPCGNAVSPDTPCGSTGLLCDGSPGSPTTCGEYCTNTASR